MNVNLLRHESGFILDHSYLTILRYICRFLISPARHCVLAYYKGQPGERNIRHSDRADSTVYIYRVLLGRIIRDLPNSGDSEVIIGVLVIK